MGMFYSFVITLAVILNSIESSSQSDGHLDSKRNPGTSASSSRKHARDRFPTEEQTPRIKSRSPASRPPSMEVLGYKLGQLGYIRLIPRTNQSLTFEFRSYIFPAGIPIRWRADRIRICPLELQEHIVLSTSDGDIFAILTNSGSLSGILQSRRGYSRVKVNMISGKIDYLTPDEMRDCPVGRANPIFPHNFVKAWSNYDSLQFKWDFDSEPIPGSSPPARQHPPERYTNSHESLIRERSKSPPIRPPSHEVLGYTMEQLGYVRLFPVSNQSQQFEFRRYVFPTDKPIRMVKDMITYLFKPTQEYIVLSTSDGDVFAILDHSGTLRGIYRTGRGNLRVKINMMSGAVEDVTPDERRDCPLGDNNPIFPNRFIRVMSDSDSLQFKWNPNGERTPYIPPATRQHSPERNSWQEPSLDARPRSPPGRPPTHEVLGYSLKELGYIRLIPQNNPNRQFEFRRYVFPATVGIYVMLKPSKYVQIPTREHIVLSTSNGDVFAILEYTWILRGTYKLNKGSKSRHSRIKINMISGEINCMTEFEINECHVGNSYPIFPRWFNRLVTNEDSLNKIYH